MHTAALHCRIKLSSVAYPLSELTTTHLAPHTVPEDDIHASPRAIFKIRASTVALALRGANQAQGAAVGHFALAPQRKEKRCHDRSHNEDLDLALRNSTASLLGREGRRHSQIPSPKYKARNPSPQLLSRARPGPQQADAVLRILLVLDEAFFEDPAPGRARPCA